MVTTNLKSEAETETKLGNSSRAHFLDVLRSSVDVVPCVKDLHVKLREDLRVLSCGSKT